MATSPKSRFGAGLWIIGFLFLGIAAPVAFADPPPNDNFANRITLPSGACAVDAGDNSEATSEANEPAFLAGGKSMWWRWTAPKSGPVLIQTVGSFNQVLLGVYLDTNGTLPGLTTVATNTNPTNGLTQVTFNATANATYAIGAGSPAASDADIYLEISVGNSLASNVHSPLSNGVATGQTMSFNAGATAAGGLNLVYQWFQDGIQLVDGVQTQAPLAGMIISGATTPVLTASNIPLSASGTIVYAVITNSDGSGAVTTAPADFTVFETTAFIDTQPSSISITAGATASFTVVAEGGPVPTFIWRRNGTALAPGLQGSGSNITISAVFDSNAHTTTSTLTIANANNAAPGDAGTYSVDVSNTTSGTLNVASSSPATLTIGKANQTAPVIYGASTTSYGAIYSAVASQGTGAASWALGTGSTQPGASVNASTGVISTNALGTVVVKAMFVGDANHNASAYSGSFTVTVGKATLGVSADPKTRVYGTPNPALTLTYTGFVNNETTANLTALPTAATAAGIASPGGTYAIVPSGGSATNYAFSYQVGTLTVVRLANADFNADQKSDLLWTNPATGERLLWFMNGTTYASYLSLGNVATQWQVAATADFNGDGHADILWQNSATGELLVWLMNGTTYLQNVSLGSVPAGWQAMAAADFNNDGKPDILFQNTNTGARLVWLMNGTAFASSVSLGTLATQWSIAAADDFNGDGHTDIVFQNTATGKRTIWLMNGTTLSSSVVLGVFSNQWSIAGTGDFNGDGQPDLIVENTLTGERRAWLMNGTSVSGNVSIATIDPGWSIGRPAPAAAVARDFNGDGDADILWQNTATGEHIVWEMSGSAYLSTASLPTIATAWQVAALGDFNGDGYTDILWQNTSTGQRLIWLMNGTAYASSVSLGTVSTAWSIAGAADFNGDGQTDILWQNTSTGDRAVWLMNGTSYASNVPLGNLSIQWSIAAAADFNGDGKADILFQNSATGARTVWLMNGTAFSSNVPIGSAPAQWSIVGTGDFNEDGHTDILWQNTSTGERLIWLMNGTTYASSVSLGTIPVQWSMRD